MNKMNLKFSTQTAETGIHYLLREIRFTDIHMADGRLFQGLMSTRTVSMFHNSHSTAFTGGKLFIEEGYRWVYALNNPPSLNPHGLQRV